MKRLKYIRCVLFHWHKWHCYAADHFYAYFRCAHCKRQWRLNGNGDRIDL
jgi:hypothetical protein